MNLLHKRMYSCFILSCSMLLSGCGNPHWLDKYGEKLCVAVESHKDLMKTIKDNETLKMKRAEVEASVKEFESLQLEATNYSYKSAQKDPSIKIDQQKLAKLSKRIDDALDLLVPEVDRIEGFVERGKDPDTDQMIIAATRIFENPLNPHRKRGREQFERDQIRRAKSAPPPPIPFPLPAKRDDP